MRRRFRVGHLRLVKPLSYTVSLLLLLPLLVVILVGLSPPGAAEGTFVPAALAGLANSLVHAVFAALVAGVVGAAVAFGIDNYTHAGKRWLERLVVLPLLIPPFMSGTLWHELLSPTGPFAGISGAVIPIPVSIESGSGFVFCSALSTYPYVYLLCRLALAHHRPYLAIGAVTGLGPRASLRRLLWPFVWPAMLFGVLLAALEASSDTATATALSVNAGTRVLHDLWFLHGQPRLAARLALVLLLFALGLWAVAGRVVSAESFRQLLLPPPRDPRTGPRGSAVGAAIIAGFCFLPPLLGFGIPMAAALVGFAARIHRLDLTSLAAGCGSTVALVAVVVLLCAAWSLVLLTARELYPSRFSRGVVAVVCLAYVLPATVLALGVLMVGHHGGLLERYLSGVSFVILCFTLSLRFGVFMLIPISAGLAALPRRLGEVASTLGLTPGQSLWRLYLPGLRRFWWLGGLLVILQGLRETTITVVLHPFGFEPIAVKTQSLMRIDMVPESGVWLLALVLLGLNPLFTLEGLLLGRQSTGG